MDTVLIVGSYVLPAILPPLARSWRGWCLRSMIASAPLLWSVWTYFQATWDKDRAFAAMLAYTFAGSLAIGMLFDALGLIGERRGWTVMERPAPVIAAFFVVLLPIAYVLGATY